jgi:[protein-PII] uridylyltransferase
MSGGDSAPTRSVRITKAKDALLERIKDLPAAAREHAVSRHYGSYWLAFDAEALEFHARIMAAADSKGEKLALGARGDALPGVTEFVIYAGDHPGLFSRLAGALTLSGASIVDAKIFTTSDGYALDVFRVRDTFGSAFDEPARVERLRQMIMKTLAGEILPRSQFAKRTRGKREAAFDVAVRVNFDNEASARATVIEVESHDKIGLVYEITRTLSELGLSISSAIITTYGELAVDVFYVRDGYGHKILRPSRLAEIETRLRTALEG